MRWDLFATSKKTRDEVSYILVSLACRSPESLDSRDSVPSGVKLEHRDCITVISLCSGRYDGQWFIAHQRGFLGFMQTVLSDGGPSHNSLVIRIGHYANFRNAPSPVNRLVRYSLGEASQAQKMEREQ